MPFHWYYLQFHSRVGSAARQLRAFPPSAIRVESMSSSSGREVKSGWGITVTAKCDRHKCTHQIRLSKSTSAESTPRRFAFFVAVRGESGLVFWTPSARLALADSCSVCVSWWLQGLWGEESLLEKRGRGPLGPQQACHFRRPPQLSFSGTVKKKGFPSLYCASFVQLEVEGMSVWSGLFSSFPGLHARLLYSPRTVYLSGDLHLLWASDFSPPVCLVDQKGGAEFNSLF